MFCLLTKTCYITPFWDLWLQNVNAQSHITNLSFVASECILSIVKNMLNLTSPLQHLWLQNMFCPLTKTCSISHHHFFMCGFTSFVASRILPLTGVTYSISLEICINIWETKNKFHKYMRDIENVSNVYLKSCSSETYNSYSSTKYKRYNGTNVKYLYASPVKNETSTKTFIGWAVYQKTSHLGNPNIPLCVIALLASLYILLFYQPFHGFLRFW